MIQNNFFIVSILCIGGLYMCMEPIQKRHANITSKLHLWTAHSQRRGAQSRSQDLIVGDGRGNSSSAVATVGKRSLYMHSQGGSRYSCTPPSPHPNSGCSRSYRVVHSAAGASSSLPGGLVKRLFAGPSSSKEAT